MLPDHPRESHSIRGAWCVVRGAWCVVLRGDGPLPIAILMGSGPGGAAELGTWAACQSAGIGLKTHSDIYSVKPIYSCY